MAKTDRTGIYRHGSGWRATVSRGRGRTPVQKHFPKHATLGEMQAWRADTKAALRLKRKDRATAGTFAYDATRYLAAVAALSTFKTRTLHINRWRVIFGTRHRDTITAAEIRTWRDRWMTEPRKLHGWQGAADKGDRPYAASTINHWLRALSNLWTVLDGRRAPNPVRDVPEVTEPEALPRAVPYDTIEAIIAAIGTRRDTGTKNPTTKTALRLRVLAYTGLTYSQLGRMQREDVDLEGATMLVRRRKKGKGAKPACLPLLPQAAEAFKAFDEAQAWGTFSGASVRKTFMLAASKLRKAQPDLPHIRVYDATRHSLATAVYRATGDLSAVSALLQHSSSRMALRYALAAASEVLTSKLARVSDLK